MEEIKVRLYPNIDLAQMNESGNKKNGVRVQVADPDLIVNKKTLKERVNWNTKSPLEIIFKYYNLTSARVGITLSFRCSPATELLIVQKTHLDEVVEGPRVAPRFLPLLGHHLGPLLCVALRHFSFAESFGLGSKGLRVLGTMMGGGSCGKGRRLVCNCWVKDMDATSGPLLQQAHLFHFLPFGEVGGSSGGCGVSVLKNYRRLIW